jgi:uncharacterized protein
MSALELIQLNLVSPAILCFALGVFATMVRSDLKFPEPLYQGLSIYLLFAIGLKGGVALSASDVGSVWLVLASAVVLTACMPLWCFPILKFGLRMSKADAGAVSAHYASVSVVTYIAAIAFLDAIRQPYEGFLPAMVALMEVPGIVVALLLVQRKSANLQSTGWVGSVRSVLVGKSVFLLLGGLLVGILSGENGLAKVDAFFILPFQGVLCLFLLEMGMVASRRFGDLKKVGVPLVVFALMMPVVHACLGIYIGQMLGLSKGGTFVLGTLAASASYIAAPATVRLAIPDANPAYYLTSALAITFPFNLTVGIPFYFAISGLFFP